MATKSFFKNIYIKNKKSAKHLILALENAKGKGSQTVQLSRTCSDADRDTIHALFGKKK